MADQKHYSLPLKSLVIAAFFLWIPDVGFSAAAVGSFPRRGQGQGQWQLLLNNTGVVAMHMALTHQNTVLMFDQTGSGPTGYRLRHRYNGRRCTRSRNDFQDSSCYAHSIEYDISKNKISPLTHYTDPWGSSGSFLSNGTLQQIGGFGHGSRSIRYFKPCQNGQGDWKESRRRLSNERWYASNQRLPGHDRVIVMGGTRVFTYEFVPKRSDGEGAFDLPFLHQTYDFASTGGNNLYPFLHLSSDGNLFIFANRDSILFNHRRNRVVKIFPQIPGDGSRNYPSSASSVILPLDHRDNFQKVEVMVCGGAASGAYKAAGEGRYLKGLSSCGRMVITGNKHKWNMENMPGPRLLNDMLILPTGDILIVNGARSGCSGSNNARNASLEPYLYKPNSKLGKRFSVLKSTKIARMYHSSAIVLPDGRILVAGSNPNNRYTSKNLAYPTELRLQAFVPQYMGREYRSYRPTNVTIHCGDHGQDGVRYGREFRVGFSLGTKRSNEVEFNVYAPPVTTHSISMNQRMLKLRCKSMVRSKDGRMDAVVVAPPSPTVAPPGYFMLTVVNGGIPSMSQWVRFTDA